MPSLPIAEIGKQPNKTLKNKVTQKSVHNSSDKSRHIIYSLYNSEIFLKKY